MVEWKPKTYSCFEPDELAEVSEQENTKLLELELKKVMFFF